MHSLFAYGHATHPRWGMAAALVLAQLRAQLARPDAGSPPTLGLLYITDHYAEDAQEIIDHLSAQLPEVVDWAGTVGVGIASNNVEYFDEPAMALMLCALPADQYRVFSGVAPLSAAGSGFAAHTALVHADPGEPELVELIAEMAQRTRSGYLFGGLAASRSAVVQFAQSGQGHLRGQGASGSVFAGGLSGVAFGPEVALISRVTQGCQPISAERVITACDGHVVLELDGQPALETLLADLQVSLDEPQAALAQVRRTLVGLRPAPAPGERQRRGGPFGADTLVRHIIGLDPVRQAVAVAQATEVGMRLSFCERHAAAARSDLVRICAEIREEIEATEEAEAALPAWAQAGSAAASQRRIAGAIYVSCSGRGGAHFGGASAELQIVRHALGDVPLVGFFAAGEIAGNS
ncbi:MAG: FIST N-terminal domain-containing protein, partial [Betaproteobacteria bacterium]